MQNTIIFTYNNNGIFDTGYILEDRDYWLEVYKRFPIIVGGVESR